MIRLPMLESEAGRQTLETMVEERRLQAEVLIDLLRAVDEHSSMLRRRGLYQAFDSILDHPGR